MATLFTSDTHFGHARILEFQAKTRPFRDLNHMHEAIIARWNEVVKPADTVYHLGDFGFGPAVRLARKRLNGKIRLILGNHDKFGLEDAGIFESIDTLKLIDVDGQRIVLCHYAMRTWQFQSKGAWQLYGHCIDEESEILTDHGWKNYATIKVGDSLPSYNRHTGLLENDLVRAVHHFPEYDGDVYSLRGKSVDMRVTSEHKCCALNPAGTKLIELPAREALAKSRLSFLRAGIRPRAGLNLTDAMIKLWVIIAADGNVKQSTRLIRVHVWKDRKKGYIRDVLHTAGVPFKELVQKDGSSSFNFYEPAQLAGFNLKGLDESIMRCNKPQFDAVIDAYQHSDGHAIGRGVIIYSSKEREIDLLQAAAVQCGYGATKYSRTGHGFSKKESHQLCVFPAKFSIFSSLNRRVEKERVHGEHFWCITTGNGNFFMRRNGRVHLTGNSHGNLPDDIVLNSCDVGVDCWNMTPVSMAQLRAVMRTKEFKPVDHHGRDDE